MTRLDQFAANVHSQFGEDGIIEHLLDTIGVKHHVAVEFGAGDGLSCSNTARLWRDDKWSGFLVEPDAERFELLEGNAGIYNTICRRAFITPHGPYSIGALLSEHDIVDVDYMSIDVDGDDAAIFRELTVRPRIVSVEFNPTVPPHIDLRQEGLGGAFGASLRALVRIGTSIGYRFVGATYCNAFFVIAADASPFSNYETDLAVLCDSTAYTFAVTDFAGRVVLCGAPLPWGSHEPLVTPLEGAPIAAVTESPQHLRRGFESLWGPALWLPQSWANVGDPDSAAHTLLARILADEQPRLVCIDLSGLPSIDAADWVYDIAKVADYQPVLAGRVLGLVRA